MLAQSVPCDDVSSATVQAVRVASRVEVTGNDEPGVKRGESVQQVGYYGYSRLQNSATASVSINDKTPNTSMQCKQAGDLQNSWPFHLDVSYHLPLQKTTVAVQSTK